jgi:hypothetical protein
MVACGGGNGDSDPTPTARPDPEATLRQILDSLNRGDVEGFYNSLSADRRQQTSVQQLEGALNTARLLVGGMPRLEPGAITAKRVNGDNAEVDVTLNVVIPSGPIPVTNTAILKFEDGGWHLGDGFLDQALAVLGLGGGATSSPSPVR